MKVLFKATSALVDSIRHDLARPHAFAYERVGFISAGASACDDGVVVLAYDYRPVDDADYLEARGVGAMMGPEAIRKALQWSMQNGAGIFHVHSHGGRGEPAFSRTDSQESAKFVPDFLKVTPQFLHGAIVLSDDGACGRAWLSRELASVQISEFSVVGVPTRRWRAR